MDRPVRTATLAVSLLVLAACVALALAAYALGDTPPTTAAAAVPQPPAFAVLPGVALAAAGRSGPLPMAVGDFNRDGRSDLAIYPGSKVVVRYGTKAGSLGAEHVVGLPGWSRAFAHAIATADVNRDGRLDLVVLASLYVRGDDHVVVAVLLNGGHGNFRLYHRYDLGSFAFADPSALAVRDLNGDHRPDIMVAVGTKLVVLLGNGHGAFGSERVSRVVSFDKPGDLGPLTTLAFGDINGDHRIDVVAGGQTAENEPSGILAVLLGRGNGTFVRKHVSVDLAGLPVRVALADLDRDGRLDLVVQYQDTESDWDAGPFYPALVVSLGDGHGAFTKLAEYDLAPQTQFSPPFAAADFNHDGHLDLAIATNGALDVLLGNGDGTFQAPVTFSGPFTTPQALVAGDFNGDRWTDVLVQPLAATGVMFLNSGTAG